MKYRLTIEGDFEKGECKECPYGNINYDIYRDFDVHCLLVGDENDCPLEEVGDE